MSVRVASSVVSKLREGRDVTNFVRVQLLVGTSVLHFTPWANLCERNATLVSHPFNRQLERFIFTCRERDSQMPPLVRTFLAHIRFELNRLQVHPNFPPFRLITGRNIYARERYRDILRVTGCKGNSTRVKAMKSN